MIAPADHELAIWGAPRTGGPWEQYHEGRGSINDAFQWVERLRRSRPDRLYVIQLAGDPAPKPVARTVVEHGGEA
jgi:hypothetical protein